VSVPELVIEGGPRPRLRNSLRELRLFRAIVLAFAERDVRVKYKQALLGITWAVIQPLCYMVIFTVFLGRGAGVSGGGAPYAAFALSGLVPWTYLQSAISFGANALITDSALLRKVYFPREVPVIGSVISSSLDFAIGLLLFVIVGPLLGAQVSATWLLAIPLGVALAALSAGVSLATAALNVYYRDFRYALPFALQLWLFASPVAYPLSVVPANWRGLYLVVNPAAGLLDSFHSVLALGQLPDPGPLAVSLVMTALVLALGYRIFKSLEPNFADVV
jgi:lipopolysaccharide transport system permease protein